MPIPKLTVSKFTHGHVLIKYLLLKLNFCDEGHLHGNSLFYIPSIYRKYIIFEFLGCGICMHIPILAGVQNGHLSHLKKSVFLLKNVLFEVYFTR